MLPSRRSTIPPPSEDFGMMTVQSLDPTVDTGPICFHSLALPGVITGILEKSRAS